MYALLVVLLIGGVSSSDDFTTQQLFVASGLVMEPVDRPYFIYNTRWKYVHHERLFAPRRKPSSLRATEDDLTSLIQTSYDMSNGIFKFQGSIMSTFINEKTEIKQPQNTSQKLYCPFGMDYCIMAPAAAARTTRSIDWPGSKKVDRITGWKNDSLTVRDVNTQLYNIRQIVSTKEGKRLKMLKASDSLHRLEESLEDSAQQQNEDFLDFLKTFREKDNVEDRVTQNTIILEDMFMLSQVFKGYLPESWITRESLDGALKDVASKIPTDFEIQLPAGDNGFFYNNQLVDRYELDDEEGIFIHLSIPITKRNTKYRIYKPIPIPTMLSVNTTCRIHLPPQYILKDENSATFFSVNEGFFEDCFRNGFCNLGNYDMSIHSESSCFSNECDCETICYDNESGFELVTYGSNTRIAVAGAHTIHVNHRNGNSTTLRNNFANGFARYVIPCGHTVTIDQTILVLPVGECKDHGPILQERVISKCYWAAYQRGLVVFDAIQNPNAFFHLTISELIGVAATNTWEGITFVNIVKLATTITVFIVVYNFVFMFWGRKGKKNKVGANVV